MHNSYIEVNGARPFVTFNFEGVSYRYTISRIFEEFTGRKTLFHLLNNEKLVKTGTYYLAWGFEKYPEPKFEDNFHKLTHTTSLILFKDIDGNLEITKQYPYVGANLEDIILHEPKKT